MRISDMDTMEPMEELNERLYEAIANGSILDAGGALKDGANVNSINYPYSPLHMAINGKFYHIMLDLIVSHSADVNVRVDNNTVLHYACELDDPIAVEILIYYGASIYDKCSPLHNCIRNNSFNAFRQILQMIPYLDINVQDNYGCTLLHLACMGSNIDFFNIIINYPQCDVNKCNYDLRTALHISCIFNSNRKIIKTLLDNDAYKNDCDSFDRSPIFYACARDYHSIVEELLLADVFVDGSVPEIRQHFLRHNLPIPG